MIEYLKGRLVIKGERGYSAYEIACQHGFRGSEEDWLASLSSNEKLSIVQEINEKSGNTTVPSTKAIFDYINDYMRRKDEEKYHIGKLIFDTENRNPQEYLGFGEWVLWGGGRVPVGCNLDDSNYGTSEKELGNETVKLTPKGTIGDTTLNINQIPAHNHGSGNYTATSGGSHFHGVGANTTDKEAKNYGLTDVNVGGIAFRDRIMVSGNFMKSDPAGSHTHSITGVSSNTGGTKGHNHTFTGIASDVSVVQPGITCYIFKRIA